MDTLEPHCTENYYHCLTPARLASPGCASGPLWVGLRPVISGRLAATSGRSRSPQDFPVSGRRHQRAEVAVAMHAHRRARQDVVAIVTMRRVLHDGQTPRPWHEKRSGSRGRTARTAPEQSRGLGCHTPYRASALPNRSTARAMSTARIVPAARSTVAGPSAGKPIMER
jgi:hypothetical protein